METEVGKVIPFLDVLNDNPNNIFKATAHPTSNYSGLLLNFNNFLFFTKPVL